MGPMLLPFLLGAGAGAGGCYAYNKYMDKTETAKPVLPAEEKPKGIVLGGIAAEETVDREILGYGTPRYGIGRQKLHFQGQLPPGYGR